jgi:hypothetical protein
MAGARLLDLEMWKMPQRFDREKKLEAGTTQSERTSKQMFVRVTIRKYVQSPDRHGKREDRRQGAQQVNGSPGQIISME